MIHHFCLIAGGVPGLDPTNDLTEWSLHVLLVSMWASYRHSGFPPHSKDMTVRLIGESKLSAGMCVCEWKVCGPCNGLVTCPWCIPASRPMHSGIGSSPLWPIHFHRDLVCLEIYKYFMFWVRFYCFPMPRPWCDRKINKNYCNTLRVGCNKTRISLWLFAVRWFVRVGWDSCERNKPWFGGKN